MKKYVFALCIILIIVIIISIKLKNRHDYLTNIYLNVPKHNIQDQQFKTGDIILFQNKETDIRWRIRYLLCAAIFGTHITHIGIVVVLNNKPYLYECGMDRESSIYDLLSKTYITHNTSLCTLTPLYQNIKYYNGYVLHHSIKHNDTIKNESSIFNYLKENTGKRCKLSTKRLFSILFNTNACDEDDSYTVCIEIVMNLLKYLNILESKECVYNYNFCDVLTLLSNKYDKPILLKNDYSQINLRVENKYEN